MQLSDYFQAFVDDRNREMFTLGSDISCQREKFPHSGKKSQWAFFVKPNNAPTQQKLTMKYVAWIFLSFCTLHVGKLRQADKFKPNFKSL